MPAPYKFDGHNVIMTAPPGAEDRVQDLPVYRTNHLCVSAWKFSAEELAQIARDGGVVFLSVWASGIQVPVFIGPENAVREVCLDYGPVWKRS